MRILTHSLAAVSAVLLAPLGLAAIAISPKRAEGLAERLGALPELEPGCIWIHGASVGEIQVARRLAKGLQEKGHRSFLSAMTVTGRGVLQGSGDDLECTLCPLDHPWIVKRALARVQPKALVLIETELWPFWIAEAKERGIPVIIASARISDRSLPRYRRWGSLARSILKNVAAVGARTELDAERFRTLGADPDRVQVTGDLKLDLPAELPSLAEDLAAVLQGPAIFVAASTHPGEEEAALHALERAEQAGREVALVVAPRHLERLEAVEQLLKASGRSLRRRTALGAEPLRPGEILLVDTLGELSAILSKADVAFVGGTLVEVGGHNVLEPAVARKPVLFGPNTNNVGDAADLLLAAGAAKRVADADALGEALIPWLCDSAAAETAGARGYAELEKHSGAVVRTVALLEHHLESTEECAK